MQIKKHSNTSFLVTLTLALLLCLLLTNCQTSPKNTLFQLRTTAETGIDFRNEITEDETHNILNFTNLYTGSGVGIGDFNNDSYPDIFFGGNQVSSELYLNKGEFKFEKITIEAGVQTDRWITGVSVVDINRDGWQDIYLNVSGNAPAEKRANLLYVNQGSHPTKFVEQAQEYGLADTSQCTHTAFFDYDRDGDLDAFIIVNPTDYKLFNVNTIRKRKRNGEAPSTDKLYRNNGDRTFTDVSAEAGILLEGYSLGLHVADFNDDTWPDIYVTNDFLTNDILYINNQDGTFRNRAAEMMQHTSFASMGIDVADLNNDGAAEIHILDMFPEGNERQKMIMSAGSYDRFQYMLQMDYEPQYSRNTLQLNNGNATFSEIGQLAEVHKTDWSWSTLLADLDNDGWRDIYVTNGFRRDLGNLDYINFSNSNQFGSPEAMRERMLASIKEQPGAQLPNYVFHNQKNLQFEQKTAEWGLATPSYSNGAAYADFDRDGDLDLVVNNVSQNAFIYENKSETTGHNWVKIDLKIYNANLTAFGAKVWLYAGGQVQVAEKTLYRGYQSTMENTMHFGLGNIEKIDSIRIQWPDGTQNVAYNSSINAHLIFHNKGATPIAPTKQKATLFQEIKATNSLNYQHQEDAMVDFKIQSLLPHQHALQGPCLAVADINGDNLEDLFIGGAAKQSGIIFVQNKKGNFTQFLLNQDITNEDVGALFLDIDGDNDQDLYVVSGGTSYLNDPTIYQDRLYLNDGTGNFTKAENVLPEMKTSGKAITAHDFDADGDLDLFVGGRVSPANYPTIPRSYLLENEGGIFKDVTAEKAPELMNVGMVTDALWSDYDLDGKKELILVGEWMPISIFKNQNGQLNAIQNKALEKSQGWWNCLTAADFDGDGDEDYLLGNLGLNTNYRASIDEPMCLYAKDFDKNGSIDPVLCQYLAGIEQTVATRDQLIGQMPRIKKQFNDYTSFATSAFSDVFTKDELTDAQILQAHQFANSYLENKGNGQFELRALPRALQIAPIQDFLVQDFNKDGHLDALAVGNSYATEVVIGRYDAFTGAYLQGDGTGNFKLQNGIESGFLATKDARNIVVLNTPKQSWILVGNNSDSLQVFDF